MVLWEITLGTAYFLGLKRSYKLALKIQRRLISPKHPRIRQFVQRRTRNVFDIALKVHRNIQARDLEAGRNLGNWLLRWLDRMKPSAQIRGPPPSVSSGGSSSNAGTAKHVTNSVHMKSPGSTQVPKPRESDRHLFTSTTNTWSKPPPTIAMMMRPPRSAGTHIQFRQISRGLYEGVVRKDIMQWMLRN